MPFLLTSVSCVDMVTTTKFFFIISLVNLLVFPPRPTAASSKITAIFVFGDSIVDPGNNNNSPLTYAKANHPPYGIDFPGRVPTGRFSNGKIVTDFLVSKLGLKESLPAYLDPTLSDQDLLTGCSFATAGSGLDDLSAFQFNVPTLTAQLKYFEEAVKRMERTYGLMEAGRVVENAFFVVVTGSNDVLKNIYELRFRRYYSLSGYHDFMLGKLETVIRKLYKMRARKIGVTGLPPIGCIPLQMTTTGIQLDSHNFMQYKCVNQQNVDSQSYNAKLRNLTSRLQQTLPESRIEYIDIYNPLMDMIEHPATYGFEITDKGCCGTGLLEHGLICNSVAPVCPDPSKYLFWDAGHPTQTANSYLAEQYFMQLFPNGTAA